MGRTKTQNRRYSEAMWLYDVVSKDRSKPAHKIAKQWKLQADAADRRVEMRKGRTSAARS